jgi:hypothetical protein
MWFVPNSENKIIKKTGTLLMMYHEHIMPLKIFSAGDPVSLK